MIGTMRIDGLTAVLVMLVLAPGSAARAEEPRCGNGVVEAGEACDLGIGNEVGRQCTEQCVEPRCGDRVLDVDEACDDGNTIDRDGCSASCADEWQPRWRSTFDAAAPVGEQFLAVALTPEGPVAVGYAAQDIYVGTPLVVGFDHQGQRRFEDQLPSGPDFSEANAVAAIEGDGGGVVVVGELADRDGGLHPTVWRYEADGSRRYGVELDLAATSGSVTAVVPVSAEQAFVTGLHDPLAATATGWIGEIDPRDGTLAWFVPLDDGMRANDLSLAPDGYLVVAGTTSGVRRIWVGAFELDGTPRWIHVEPSWSEQTNDYATSVAVAADGSIYATGAVATMANGTYVDFDLWVGAFDPDGTPRWSQAVAGAEPWSDEGSDVVLDAEGRPLVVGTLQTQPLLASVYWDRDAWLRQYDTDGETLWTWTYDDPLHLTDSGNAAAFTDEGAVVLVGGSAERRHGQDALVLELLPPSAIAPGRSAPASPRPPRSRGLYAGEPEPLALDERGPHRATLHVDLDGGELQPGDRGSLHEVPCLQSTLTYPGFAGDDQTVQAITDRVAAAMSPYGVQVRADDALPPHLPRTTVVVGGLAEQIGLDAAAAGYSCVVDCGDRWSWDLAFAFVRDVPTIANTVLHEAAHTWGLDHVISQDLLMYPLGANYDADWGTGCVDVSDETSAPECLDYHERWCPAGQQDSHAELLAAFGPAVLDMEPPLVEILAPPSGQRLDPGQPLELELRVEDDDGDPGHRVVVPELEWERVAYGNETELSLALPPGTFTVRVEAIDHAGNESTATIEVVVGNPPPPPRVPTGDDDDDDDDDDVVPYSGRLDDGCRIGHGASGWPTALVVLLVVGWRPRRRA